MIKEKNSIMKLVKDIITKCMILISKIIMLNGLKELYILFFLIKLALMDFLV